VKRGHGREDCPGTNTSELRNRKREKRKWKDRRSKNRSPDGEKGFQKAIEGLFKISATCNWSKERKKGQGILSDLAEEKQPGGRAKDSSYRFAFGAFGEPREKSF